MPSSFKRKRSSSLNLLRPDTFVPTLISPTVRIKYDALKHNPKPGIGISFNSFPDILDKFQSIGWECLVVFSDRVGEFYTNMSFNRDLNGTLISLSTCVQGIEAVIDEILLVKALGLKESMLE